MYVAFTSVVLVLVFIYVVDGLRLGGLLIHGGVMCVVGVYVSAGMDGCTVCRNSEGIVEECGSVKSPSLYVVYASIGLYFETFLAVFKLLGEESNSRYKGLINCCGRFTIFVHYLKEEHTCERD